MIADVFRAVPAAANPCERRVVPALLYSICPAAARWWLVGAVPATAFDPLETALRARAEGRTLRGVLESWALTPLLPHAKQYVGRVEAWRAAWAERGVPTPELLPFFLGEQLLLEARAGLDHALQVIGGRQNFFPFIRAWAFTILDWQRALRFPALPRMAPCTLHLNEPHGGTVVLQIWTLQAGARRALGSLAADARHPNLLLAGLLNLAVSADPAFNAQELFALDAHGRAERIRSRWEAAELWRQVRRLAALAESGPCPPIQALHGAVCCLDCPYRQLCWLETRGADPQLTPLALEY